MRSQRNWARSEFSDSYAGPRRHFHFLIVNTLKKIRSEHIPVLLKESIDGLDFHPGERVFEGTVGLGGHSEEILKRIGEHGIYIGTDEDAHALTVAEKRLAPYSCTKVFHEGNFRKLDEVLDAAGCSTVDKILFDIGLSNLQLEEKGRGFSFKKSEPLLMTFRPEPQGGDLTAREIVNEWAEESIADGDCARSISGVRTVRKNSPRNQDVSGTPYCGKRRTRCFAGRPH
ncbi:MAG: Ribosomal RNA small subunit methyltransferase H [Parcubacteria group bacterium GW2011_GWA1_47_8]|nr:MAG: Ribosomal RNA small subunit methyltransferase H [Parcubacteria group bacterium GW2011_GWA1_47_8]